MKKIVALFAFLSGFQTLANPTVGLQSAVVPVEGVKVGKASHGSIRKMTPAMKSMLQDEWPLGKDRRFGEIPEDAVLYMKNYHASLKDMREISRNLTFELSDVSGSDLDRLVFEGAYPEGPTKTGPWSSLTKVYKREDDVLIFFHEWDFVGDGGGMMMVDEMMNVKVKDAPGRISLKKSPSGSIVSELMWVTKKRFYTLTVLDDVVDSAQAKYNVEWLLKLAGGIKSQPVSTRGPTPDDSGR